MNQWVCLVFLLFIRTSWQVHPRYTYVCKEDGSVQLTGFKTGSTVTIVNATNSSCITPTPKTTTTYTDKHTITKECMGEDLSITRTIDVTVQDGNLHETGITRTSQAPVVGGLLSHTFTLTCDPIKDVERTVLRQFHLTDIEKIYNQKNEIDQVDMLFKAENNIALPDISEAYTGDELYMFLQYKGVSEYMIAPIVCTAYKGNDKQASGSDKQELWKSPGDTTTHCVNESAITYNLMGEDGFKYVDKNTVVARIYAFHFKGNDDITIECSVSIKQNNAVAKDTSACSAQSGRRRKRSSDKEVFQKDIVKTLTIKDPLYAPSNHGSILHFNGLLEALMGVTGILAVYVL